MWRHLVFKSESRSRLWTQAAVFAVVVRECASTCSREPHPVLARWVCPVFCGGQHIAYCVSLLASLSRAGALLLPLLAVQIDRRLLQ